jgi:hypothetical protein
VSYPVILRAIVIDGTNNAINFREGANTAVAAITPGTYFLRGDGTADDLLAAIKAGLETNVGARTSVNTYTVAITWSADPAAPTATVTITRASGADTFQLLFATSTTFDAGVIGFPQTDTALNASPKASTLSPSAAWASSDVYRELEPEDAQEGFAQRARSGVVAGGSVGGQFDDLRLSIQLVDGEGRGLVPLR